MDLPKSPGGSCYCLAAVAGHAEVGDSAAGDASDGFQSQFVFDSKTTRQARKAPGAVRFSRRPPPRHRHRESGRQGSCADSRQGKDTQTAAIHPRDWLTTAVSRMKKIARSLRTHRE